MPIGGPKLRYIGSEAVNLENILLTALPAVQLPATLQAGTAEIILGKIESTAPVYQLDSVKIVSPATITANASDYATFAVNAHTATAAARVLASITTASANMTALTEYSMTIDNTKALLPGDWLTLSIAKANSGVATPEGVCVELQFKQ